MADLTITPGSVLAATTGVTFRDVTAGTTITAGQVVYLDSTDSDAAKLAITTTAATAACIGIATHAALDNQPLRILIAGNITIGATTAVNAHYWVSSNAGFIANTAPTTGQYGGMIGIGVSTTVIKLWLATSGAATA